MAKTVKELSSLVEQLVEKCNELEQRSSNFAARINALNKASRDEIRALREEVAGLKGVRMNTRKEPLPTALPRITATQWAEAMKALKFVPGEERSFFPPAEVRGMALKLSRLDANVTALRAEEAEFADSLRDEEVEL